MIDESADLVHDKYPDDFGPATVWDYTDSHHRVQKWSFDDRPRIIRFLAPPEKEINFKRPDSFGISGVRDSGKSSLLTSLIIAYHTLNGSTILDAYSQSDMESLCLLLSGFRQNCVLVHGEGVEYKFHETKYSTIPASELDARNLPGGRIFLITRQGFGPDEADEVLYYDFLNRLAADSTRRLTYDKDRPSVWAVREASEFIGSRLRASASFNKRLAESEFVRFHTTAVHTGFAVAYDRARFISADKEIRELTTWNLMKAQGQQDIPRQLNWLYKFVTYRFLRRMKKPFALCSSESGGLGILKFRFPYWLSASKTGKSITDQAGIEVVYDTEKLRSLERELRSRTERIPRKAISLEMHEDLVRRHVGEGSVNDPKGESLRELSIKLHVGLNTVQRSWAEHRLREYGCSSLE